MREFRVHHDELTAAGITVAGVSLDPIDVNRRWAERLALPYPMLSDPDRVAGRALHVLQRVSLGGWHIEFFRRATVLADDAGIIRRVWDKVRIRGHGREVLDASRALAGPPA